jgi:hypothetical protein
MGKQNFIQGGFKGKVGAVVGAGWKDMLVIKAYTKPANPKTERQVTVRNAFKLKVKASQLANQCNYGTSLFTSTSNTSWGLRMAAASSFYAEDKNLLQFVPLIPYGYTPDYPTSADPQITGGAVVLSWDTTDDLSGRSVNVLIWALNDTSAEYEPVIIAATVSGSSGAWTATASVPAGFSVGEDSYLTAVSSDDASFSDKTLYQPPVSIGTSIVDLPFTLTLASGPTWTSGNDYVLFTFTPSETLSDTVNLTPTSSAYGVLQGDFVTDADTAAAQIISNVVTVAVPITLDSLGQRPMFVSGSSLTLGAFAYADNTYRYIFEGATFNLAETPTQQRMLPESETFSYHDFEIMALVKTTSAQVLDGPLGHTTVKTLDSSTYGVTTKSADIYSYNETGAIYALCDLLESILWGSTQAPTAFTNPVFIINGVPYEITFSAPMFVPNVTSASYTAPAFNNPDADFFANTTEGVIYFQQQAQSLPAVIADCDATWWQDLTLTWQGTTTTVKNSGVYIDISGSGAVFGFMLSISYPQLGSGNVVYSCYNNQAVTYPLVIYESDGFIINLTIPAFSLSGELEPS